jgi:hypothetical protein
MKFWLKEISFEIKSDPNYIYLYFKSTNNNILGW